MRVCLWSQWPQFKGCSCSPFYPQGGSHSRGSTFWCWSAGHVCMCGRGAGIPGVAIHGSVLPRPGQGHTCGGLQGPGCECACSSNSSMDMGLGEAVAALEVGCGHARDTGDAGVWGKGMHGATAPLRSMVCTQWHQAQAWARGSAPAQGREQGTPSLWGCSNVNFRQLRQRELALMKTAWGPIGKSCGVHHSG